MKRRWLIPILVPAATILIGLSLLTSVNASDVPPGPPWGHPDVCASGALDGAWSGPTPGRLNLTGWIAPCADADPAIVSQARIGLGLYGTGGAFVNRDGAIAFTSTTGPTDVGRYLTIPSSLNIGPAGRLQALCLVTALTTRVACVSVSGGAGTVSVAPLPITDPQVNRPTTVMVNNSPEPECVACV